MKDIEIKCRSEAEALESAAEHFRIPEQAFNVLEVSDAEEEGQILVRLRIKMDYFKERARHIVNDLLEHMKVPAEVSARAGRDFLTVEIHTERGSILIGRRGQTLDAIQHIVNRMVSRNERNIPMILVDVENYRVRANRRLAKVAERAAQKVERTGRPVKLDPMTSHERKFIHKLLSDWEGIITYSIGREGQRCIVIAEESAPKTTSSGDEELLPELLNDTELRKPKRPLLGKKRPRNANPKPLNHTDGMGDLIDPGMLDG